MYPQSMFWTKNKKNRYTLAYPSFTIEKWGQRGVFIARTCFPDVGSKPRKQEIAVCETIQLPYLHSSQIGVSKLKKNNNNYK